MAPWGACGAGRRSPLPRKPERARTPRGVVDTSVLVAGISGFRPRLRRRDNDSARLIRRWVERRAFVWLVSTTFSTSTGTCFAGSVCGARRSAEC
jgi:hypothetical protein